MKEHSPFISESRNKADHNTAKKLVEEFNLNVKSCGYHYEGNFYNEIELYTYPIAFLDLYGYIIINSEHELKTKMDVGKRVHKFGGISRMNNYILYPQEPIGIEKYQEIIKKYKLKKGSENKNGNYFTECILAIDKKINEIHNDHKSFN